MNPWGACGDAQGCALLAAEDDGLTAREIAEAKGVPVTTIEWWLREARAALEHAIA